MLFLTTAWTGHAFYRTELPPLREGEGRTHWKNGLKKVNVNAADSATLEALPGIGPKLASRLVKYRNYAGCFHSRDDLGRVYGITPEILKIIENKIFFGPCNRAGKKKPWKQLMYEKREKNHPQRAWVRPLEKINLNEADSATLVQYDLLPPWLAGQFVRERAWLGCFTGWVQVSRLSGMNPEFLDTLQVYAEMGTCLQELRPRFPRKEREPFVVDLNLSDSIAFRKIPGMRPGLIGRIIRYRNRLGHFLFPDQVLEMKNPPGPEEWAEILPYLAPINPQLLPDSCFIYVNQADQERLGRHPYIGYSLAERIINYRHQHGKFVSLESLRKIYGVKPGTWEKLRPYIRFE